MLRAFHDLGWRSASSPYRRFEHTSENDKGQEDENSPHEDTAKLYWTVVYIASRLLYTFLSFSPVVDQRQHIELSAP
jgi:hypothetical protein